MNQERQIPSATGLGELCVRLWIPENTEIRGLVQIAHGMAEHMERYADFAGFLNGKSYLVAGADHAGHGKSLLPGEPPGYFGEEKGWEKLVEDVHGVSGLLRDAYPGLPLILLGHSMGSFLARSYAARYGQDGADAYIFSGTAGTNALLPMARLLVKRAIRREGAKGGGESFNKLAFGAYAKAIPDARTPFDWLCTDSAIVNAYMQDPLCGFVFTLGGFRDLFDGLYEIQQKDWARETARKPILLFSGIEDPVGGKRAKGVREVAKRLEDAGHDVELILYEGGRHEMLNEVRKQRVYEDVLSFLARKAVL